MSQIALVLLWLGTSDSYLHLQSDLDAWSRARQVRIVAPKTAAVVTPIYDAALIDDVERRLEQARILAASNDEGAALRVLGEIDDVLTRHPELPQAAWLMAERFRLEAGVHRDDPRRSADVQKLTRSAAALDSAPDDARAVVIRGAGARDIVFVDGRAAPGQARLAPGRHHVRVLRSGAPIWASWVSLTENSSSLDLPVPAPEPCTREDLGAPRIEAGRVQLQVPVRCPSWAVARPRAGGGVEIATCRHSRCGAMLPWRRPPAEPYFGPPQTIPIEKQRWPLFVLVGAGAIAATSIVLWQTGAFDRQSEPRFVVEAVGPPEAGARSGR